MAKMFYTMDETKAALGKSEDDIKNLARDGKLREFRDGPRLMFKADQVDTLKAELSGMAGDQIGLSAGDTHTPLGLMDSKSGSGSGAGLKADAAPVSSKDDSAGGMDVGLSGSMSGSIGGGSLAGGSMGGSGGGISSAGGSRVGSGKAGVNVFGSDESERVDPMGQTHITTPKDQISLEGVGSGSGLLDLTRETDDTSLGAALLDEISPGGSKKDKTAGGMVAIPSPSAGSSAGMTSISSMEMPSEPRPDLSSPMMQVVEADDPVAPAFALGSIAACVVILVASLVLIGAITGDNSMIDARIPLAHKLEKTNLWIMFGAGLLFSAILFFVGIFVGKLGNKRTA